MFLFRRFPVLFLAVTAEDERRNTKLDAPFTMAAPTFARGGGVGGAAATRKAGSDSAGRPNSEFTYEFGRLDPSGHAVVHAPLFRRDGRSSAGARVHHPLSST